MTTDRVPGRGRGRRRALVVLAPALAATTLASAAAGTTPDPEPEPPVCADGTFRVEFFAEVDLQGPPIVVGCQETIDVDWGTGRAHPRVPEDRFSVRWTADVELAEGVYRFTAGTDDGVRLFVDGDLVIDAWAPRPLRTSVAVGAVTAGRHEIVMEYYEQGGHAAARLRWERSPNGWFTSPEEFPGHWPALPVAPSGDASGPGPSGQG